MFVFYLRWLLNLSRGLQQLHLTEEMVYSFVRLRLLSIFFYFPIQIQAKVLKRKKDYKDKREFSKEKWEGWG